MRKFQKATAVIMAAALAATGCSAGGAKTGDPQQPWQPPAAAQAGQRPATHSSLPAQRQPRQRQRPALIRQRQLRMLLPVKRSLCWSSIRPEARP